MTAAHHDAFNNRLSTVIKSCHQLILQPIKNEEPHCCDPSFGKTLLVDIEAAAESLDLTGRVNDALRSGVERMTIGAYVYFDGRLGGVGLERVATRTLDG
jgi:hypothetical protein